MTRYAWPVDKKCKLRSKCILCATNHWLQVRKLPKQNWNELEMMMNAENTVAIFTITFENEPKIVVPVNVYQIDIAHFWTIPPHGLTGLHYANIYTIADACLKSRDELCGLYEFGGKSQQELWRILKKFNQVLH